MTLSHRVASICISVSMVGCTTLEPVPYADTGDLSSVIKVVQDRLKDYSTHASHHGLQVSYNTAVTLLAIGGVAAAVFSHGAARGNLLAGFGLGAGALATAWSWSNPSGADDAYRLGAFRASCLLNNAQSFDTSNPKSLPAIQLAELESGMDKLTTLIKTTQATISSPEFVALTKDPTQVVAATKAESAANASFQQGDNAIKSAAQEITAWGARGSTVYNTLQTIDAQVYAVVKGAPINYQDTYNTIFKSAGTGVSSGTPPTKQSSGSSTEVVNINGETTPTLISQVNDSVSAITLLAATISAEKPFSTAETKVTACGLSAKSP